MILLTRAGQHKNRVIAGIIAILNSSCALYGVGSDNTAVVTTCTVPTDQASTLSGHWSTNPVPVAFHGTDFSTSEEAAITAAADSWNTFFTASQNHSMIKYGTASSPNVSSIADPATGGVLPCAGQGIISAGANGTFSGNVAIYKVSRWPTRYVSGAIALTSFCYTANANTKTSSSYPYFFTAIIELNYQYFFTSGQKQPDMQSILLHEFGHLVGLDHACEYTTKAGYPNCGDSSINPDYVAASMFPVFAFDTTGNGQQKRSLGTNDESRANCLYTASAPTK
jgi:hypothetical protein